MNDEQRKLRARIAAHSMHSQGKTNTAPARAAFLDRFKDEPDPEAARRAYFSELARKSVDAKKKNKQRAADELDELRALVIALKEQRDTLLGVVTELRAEIARLEACGR